MRDAKWWRPFTAVLFWVLVWQLAAWRLAQSVQWSGLLLPYPADVLWRLGELVLTQHFWLTVLCSLGRVFAAFLIGAAIGSLCAVLGAISPLLGVLISPMMHIIRATPIASFIILLLLWLPGAGWVSVAAAVLMAAPIFWSNLGRSIESVDKKLIQMSRAYEFGTYKTMRHIYMPQMKSALISACESGVGLAWKAGVAAEVLTRPTLAIGKMVYETKLYLETTDLFAWTAVVVLMSLSVEKGVRAILRGGEERA